MFIDLGNGVSMSDEQFQEAMNERRELHNVTRNDHIIGCPLCQVIPEELTTEAKVAAAEKKLAAAKIALDTAEEAAAEAKAEADAQGGQEQDGQQQ
jgi:hypothetical protein